MGISIGSYYGFLVLCATFAVHVAKTSSAAVDFSGDHHLGRFVLPAMNSGCRGSMGECGGSELFGSELEMDSESNRRMLAATKYISYDAMKGDVVPCSRRGASYYNCQPGAPANPYDRGCSAMTRCRS